MVKNITVLVMLQNPAPDITVSESIQEIKETESTN
ncbi:MAG: hypothetical protein SRB2_00154 [Desulfobacteraceae bacterium Eth-SRB2]|nr:MAG: hypothetical protein SRB2_00154 [Desulfobacteraceae bacterium Eth-SRB2]